MLRKNLCEKEMEVYCRCVGFYSATKLWNKGKREELKERKMYDVQKHDIKKS